MMSHAGVVGAAGASTGGGSMPAFVSAVGTDLANGPTPFASPTKATTTGNYLVVCLTHYDSNEIVVTGITDTAGNTYTRAGTVQGGDSNQENLVYFTPSPITGNAANVCTVQSSGGNCNYRNIAVLEFSWPGTSGITLDAEATHAFPSGLALDSNAVVTTVPNSLIVGNWVSFDTTQVLTETVGTKAWEQGAGGAADDMVAAYLLTGAAGSYTLGMTQPATGRYSIVVKAFKPA